MTMAGVMDSLASKRLGKFNWQSKLQETVGKTVSGLSDSAARCSSNPLCGNRVVVTGCLNPQIGPKVVARLMCLLALLVP